jgi:glutamine synthetase
MQSRDPEAIEYVLHEARENDVKFIRLWFTDILGNLKGFAITVEELEPALRNGMGFDGSAIEGFVRSNERDLYALPDPNTFSILPWRPRTNAVARMFCDLVTPDDQPFEGDSRYVLRRNLKRAANLGYTYYVGPELEYFYFRNQEATVLMLEELGIPVESSHHEVAPSQHEIDLRHTDALTMADTVMTYRVVVKEIAMQHGCFASFMPKPVGNLNGSGMHTHMSMSKGDQNVFYDDNDPDHLSDIARGFIAGMMKHAREITAVTNQWVNSYKRLVPRFEAPTYVSWAKVNRADLIRVPDYKPGREASRRIEYRAPDASCNPYLAFSVMLAAGLEGIEKGYELVPPVEKQVHAMTDAERKSHGIESLPGSLWEAIRIAENSELVHDALGEHVFRSFIENKKIEWEQYHSHVSDYETRRYLPVL